MIIAELRMPCAGSYCGEFLYIRKERIDYDVCRHDKADSIVFT